MAHFDSLEMIIRLSGLLDEFQKSLEHAETEQRECESWSDVVSEAHDLNKDTSDAFSMFQNFEITYSVTIMIECVCSS